MPNLKSSVSLLCNWIWNIFHLYDQQYLRRHDLKMLLAIDFTLVTLKGEPIIDTLLSLGSPLVI